MVQINFARKEINCKIVYYGPGLSGKTTSLEVVHQRTPQGHKGELTSISTDGDRTLFFDFMPLDLGTIAGMKVKFHLYTVPGQVYYNSTRKLVLLGADGVIFVADSTPGRMEDNQQSMDNLRENLTEMGRDVNKLPLVIQWNKRDLPNPVALPELEAKLNPNKVPTFETSAKTGDGVFQALKSISALVLEDINSNDRNKAGGIAAGPKRAAPVAPSKVSATEPTGVSTGSMPDRDSAKVLRPVAQGRAAAAATNAAPATAQATSPGATATAAAPTKAPVAAAPTKPQQAAATAAVARPAEPVEGRAATRAPMTESKAALKNEIKNEMRQMAQKRPDAPAAAPAQAPAGNSKMFVFMALGIVAGAVAAVVAAKFLLGF
ncbi:MAG: GTPase domain-containing protein [Planctomycetes bacterium]|nr:GTPase domain-containing protein [Planctomycetota bacterium]